MRTVTVRERVRFAETDMMGVVHHANFFRWFEMGRVEYLRQAGILLCDLMDAGILFPIHSVECRYLTPARFDDVILIEAALTELSKAKMNFSYKIVREADGVQLAAGQTRNVFTDGSGRVIRLPDSWHDKLKHLADET